MPTPIEILLDPISIALLLIYISFICLEAIAPAHKLTKVNGWIPKSLIVFVGYFYLSTYLPLIWDKYLMPYQLFNLEHLHPVLATLIALLAFELLIYIWHRTMHRTDFLWKTFHQMHHSIERIDTFGAFYFSPLDMIGFTFVGSLTLALGFGLPPESISWFLYITMFLVIFQHMNVKTPVWIGYFIQRPESHSIHHKKGVHAYNYSDLPIFDIIFGTFKNPKEFCQDIGFYEGSSLKTKDILMFKDVSQQNIHTNL